MTDNVIDISSELKRKALETITFLTERLDRGLISNAEFHMGVTALWMTTSGLVGSPLRELIDLADEESKGVDRKIRRVFCHRSAPMNGLSVIIRDPERHSILMRGGDGSMLTFQADGPEEALMKEGGLIQKLFDKGWKEI